MAAATRTLSNPYVSIEATDFSAQCTEARITERYESKDVTGFGNTVRYYGAGLGDHEVTLKMFATFGASSLESTLTALVGTGDGSIIVRKSSAVAAADNPEYTLEGAYLEEFVPLGASLGELMEYEVTFKGGALTRAVA